MDWRDIPADIRNAVLFTLKSDAADSDACVCERADRRCKKMAEGYRAAFELLLAAGLDVGSE